MEGFELLKQGAEARLLKGTYLGKPTIVKERFPKRYRHADLDNHLTKERIKSECRAIVRCKSVGIKTPALYLVDFKRRLICMQYFEYSITIKDYVPKANDEEIEKLSFNIGALLGKMHSNNIIHGDLTTSNMLLVNKNSDHDYSKLDNLDLIIIDFGLAHVESSAEDKGVDLYVLERALLSTHSNSEKMFAIILKGYQKNYKSGFKEVLAKYEEVRARGRKRTMVG